MFQNTLINAVVEWEHRLQMEEERRKNLKGEPYTVFTPHPEPDRAARKPFLARIFKPGEDRQPAFRSYEPCHETQTR